MHGGRGQIDAVGGPRHTEDAVPLRLGGGLLGRQGLQGRDDADEEASFERDGTLTVPAPDPVAALSRWATLVSDWPA